MARIPSVALLLCMFVGNSAYAAHNPLLPRPQQMQYGTGTVRLTGMKIVFSSTPSAEDQFAASELSKYVEERTGVHLPIGRSGDSTAQGTTIVLDRTGATDQPLALPGDLPGPHSKEAYDLVVSGHGVKIHADTSAGVFYGIQTLRQLIEGSGPESVLPQVEIHDWPSVELRGTMVDISHGPLPTEKEIERQINFLARWKENQYYLYTENSIELKGYPLLDPAGRLTQNEVRRIVAYGRQRHIDVIPNLDLYGHQHDLFRIEKYSELSDEPHGTEFDPRNPKVMPLLTDWVNQFADLFPSPFVSIGFDETFQIERATKASGAAAAPAGLFVKQLTDVTRLFQNRGKHVMAYDDIMVKFPQIIPQLPPGLIAVAWYYTSEDPTYKRWLGPLISNHIPHVVQPGIMSYDNIAPDYNTTFENIDTFLAAGRRSGALGLINSVWADDAQLLFRMSLPGMAYGAAAPWQSQPMDRASFFSDYAAVMYPSAVAPDIASAISNLSQAEIDLQKVLGNEQTMFALWRDPFFPAYYKGLPAHQMDLHETRLHAEQAETSLFHAESLGADPATINSLMIGCELLDYAGEKFQTPVEMSELWSKLGPRRPDSEDWWNNWGSQITYQDHSRVVDLMDRITDLKPAYRAAWLQEYTPYRLGSALGRWDAEYQYWRGVQEKLQEFDDSSHAGDILPPLEKIVEGSGRVETMGK
jgi:hexosaminidase